MKRIDFRTPSIAFIFLIFGTFISAQSPVTIILNGTLADMDEEFISNESFKLDFSLIRSDENVLYNEQKAVSTDEYGDFSLVFTDLPVLLTGSFPQRVDVVLKIKAEESDWLEEGSFLVKYHLDRVSNVEYKITRFEGQQLDYSYRHPVWMFTDRYPLAYLISEFLVSFSNEVADAESIRMIAEELNNEKDFMDEAVEEEAPAQDRGLKGGYAVGGYKSKK